MARVKGKDVLLDLMDTVQKLEKTSLEQEAKLTAVATLAMSTSAQMTSISSRMTTLAQQVQTLAQQFQTLATDVARLDEDLREQAELLAATVEITRSHGQHLRRTSRLLGALADRSQDRFDDLENRVLKLERKAG